MTDGILIGFVVGFVASMSVSFACKKEKSKDLAVVEQAQPKPPVPLKGFGKYPNCRVGEKVYVNYPDDSSADLVEVLAINEAGIIGKNIDDENASAEFYAHKYVFRTYKKEGTENE